MKRLLPWPTVWLSDWPDIDRLAFQNARKSAGMLDDPGPLARHPRDRIRRLEQAWGDWLGFLRNQGLTHNTSGLEQMTGPHLEAYVACVKAALRPISVRGYMQNLKVCASGIFPTHDHAVLARLNRRVRRWASLRSRRQRPLVDANELYALSLDLMSGANTGMVEDIHDAKRFRDGLAIGMLMHAPMRIGNFARIRLDYEIRRSGDIYRINVPAEVVKTAHDLSHVLDPWLTPYIEKYLTRVRPSLLAQDGRWRRGEPSQAFWINSHGGPVAPQWLSACIGDQTEATLGIRITAHTFRSIIATLIATESPEHVGIIMPTLGHSNLRISETHYNMANTISAASSYHQVLKAISAKRPGHDTP